MPDADRRDAEFHDEAHAESPDAEVSDVEFPAAVPHPRETRNGGTRAVGPRAVAARAFEVAAEDVELARFDGPAAQARLWRAAVRRSDRPPLVVKRHRSAGPAVREARALRDVARHLPAPYAPRLVLDASRQGWLAMSWVPGVTPEVATDANLVGHKGELRNHDFGEGLRKDLGEDAGEDLGEDAGEDFGEDLGGDVGEDFGDDVGGDLGEDVDEAVGAVLRQLHDGSVPADRLDLATAWGRRTDALRDELRAASPLPFAGVDVPPEPWREPLWEPWSEPWWEPWLERSRTRLDGWLRAERPPRVPCHRDVAPRNLRLQRRGDRLAVGLVDFAHARADLGLVDIARWCNERGGWDAVREAAFWRGYRRTPDAAMRRALEAARVHDALAAIAWGTRHGDAERLALGRRVLAGVAVGPVR